MEPKICFLCGKHLFDMRYGICPNCQAAHEDSIFFIEIRGLPVYDDTLGIIEGYSISTPVPSEWVPTKWAPTGNWKEVRIEVVKRIFPEACKRGLLSSRLALLDIPVFQRMFPNREEGNV